MPIFDDEDNLFKIEFSDNSSLNLTKREGYGSTEILRKISKVQRMIQAATDRKRILQSKIDNVGDDMEALEKLQDKLEQEEAAADFTNLFVELFYESFCGWDRYATRADVQANNPKPFTKENIATIHVNKLKLIFQRISEEMNGGEEDPKQPLSESAPPLSLASTVQ